MFKKSLILLAVAAGFYTASAQSVQYEKGTTLTYVMGHAGTTDCHLVFRNLMGKTGNFVYRKVQDDFPTAWWVSFCDNINCYASFIDEDTFAPIVDSGFAEFKISVTPNGKADTSTVKYVMYEAATPSTMDTLTFIFVVEWGAGSENITTPTLQVYPNPVADVLYVSNVSNRAIVNLYDNNGKLLRTVALDSRHSIPVSDIPAGFYIISVSDGDRVLRSGFVKN